MNDTTNASRCTALPWNDDNARRLLDSQPGDAEAAAAIAGMQETYGKAANPRLPAIGDWVSGTTAGKRWSGHVEWVESNDRMVVNVGGGWVAVSPQDITH